MGASITAIYMCTDRAQIMCRLSSLLVGFRLECYLDGFAHTVLPGNIYLVLCVHNSRVFTMTDRWNAVRNVSSIGFSRLLPCLLIMLSMLHFLYGCEMLYLWYKASLLLAWVKYCTALHWFVWAQFVISLFDVQTDKNVCFKCIFFHNEYL